MAEITIKEINNSLIRAGNLTLRPICIYASKKKPRGAVPVSGVIKTGHRCLAKALLMMAMDSEVPPIFIGKDAMEECCYGALSWLGLTEFSSPMSDMLAGNESV